MRHLKIVSLLGLLFASLVPLQWFDPGSAIAQDLPPAVSVELNPVLRRAIGFNGPVTNEFQVTAKDLIQLEFASAQPNISAVCQGDLRIWVQLNDSPNIHGDSSLLQCSDRKPNHPINPGGRCDFYQSLGGKILLSIRYSKAKCSPSDLDSILNISEFVKVN